MPPLRIRAVGLGEAALVPEGRLVRVGLEDGTASSFVAATPAGPPRWLDERSWDFCHGPPILYVRSLEADAVRAAVEAMAAEMGGYWLRYYDSSKAETLVRGAGRGGIAGSGGSNGGGGSSQAVRIVGAAVTEADPPGEPGRCSSVVEALLSDGRQFSILAATPAWFGGAFESLGLPCYYGHLILFVRAMRPAVVRRAVEDMALAGDNRLCQHDTPRRTLPQVLAEFKQRHP